MKRPRFTARRLLAVAVALAVYFGLWLVTIKQGVPSVETSVYSELVAANRGVPASTVTHEDIDRDPKLTIGDIYPSYWAEVRAIGPFVLLVERGSVTGMFSGHGSTRLQLWIFGAELELFDLDNWIS